jgi:D-lactate dehydrogenase (quinone)
MMMYYGHILCHVLHENYIVAKRHDCVAGNLYQAKPQLAAFYKQPDPCNCFNPGIGNMSKFAAYKESPTPQATSFARKTPTSAALIDNPCAR